MKKPKQTVAEWIAEHSSEYNDREDMIRDCMKRTGVTRTTIVRKIPRTWRPANAGDQDRTFSLRKELRTARPRTWWDDLTTGQQKELLAIKEDHIAGRHSIKLSDILARCRAHYPKLSIGLQRFKRWIENEQTKEPTE